MPELSSEVHSYLSDSYPHNHGYRVIRGRLRPNFQLWCRWRKLRRLLPDPLHSFLDLGCSKGFFVLQAAQDDTCRSALGVDVTAENIDACRAVQAHLELNNARFELAHLDQIAARPESFGAPFQTVMLVNSYQYLFFGSKLSSHCYRTHSEIFAHLANITSERLIFSNRLELERLPGNVRARAQASGRAEEYCEASVLGAAAQHFEIERKGKLGRIPLLLMTRPKA